MYTKAYYKLNNNQKKQQHKQTQTHKTGELLKFKELLNK